MKKKMFVGILVGAVCLWFALHDVQWSSVRRSLVGIKIWPLFVVFALMFATHLFRARRYRVLLAPIKKVDLLEMFSINAVGFLAIHVFPLRIGEITRPILLKKRHGIALSTGLATVAVERVFDGLIASLALVIGLLAAPEGFGDMPVLKTGLKGLTVFAVSVFVPLLIFLTLAVIQRERMAKLLMIFVRILPQRLHQKISALIQNFFVGLHSLPNIKTFLLIFFESLGVWGVMVLAYYFAFLSFGMKLPWSAPFSVLGIVSIGIMLPSAPGFVGTFQLFVQAALALYGINKALGLSYSLVFHAINLAYIGIAGMACTPLLATKMSSLLHEVADREQDQPVF